MVASLLVIVRVLSMGATPRLEPGSVPLSDETPTLQRSLVVIAAFVRSLRKLDLEALRLLVRNGVEQMRDAVEPRAPLVVGAHDVPGRMLGVGLLQHGVARARVVVPAIERFDVHRAQLPLPQWIVDAGREPPFLLLLADLQP